MKTNHPINISFGDCDPVGIVFYPNAFRWMDAAFHALLRDHGGHARIARKLGALGLGVVDSSARFHRPMLDGDRLELGVQLTEWSRRSFTLEYKGTVAEALVFAGKEVRCLFTRVNGGIVAGDITPLRELLETTHE